MLHNIRDGIEIDASKLIEFADGEVYLKPMWMNTDNSLTLKVLLTMFQGYVSTDETRIILGGYVRDWNRSGYSKLKQGLDKVLKPIILSISIIMFFLIWLSLENIIIYFWNVDIFAKNAPSQITTISIFVVLAIIALCVAIYYLLLNYSKKMLARIFD